MPPPARPALPPDPLPQHRLSLAAIARSAEVIDPVFLGSPQFDCEPLSEVLGCKLTLKLETANPIRSFKGRGASFLVAERLRQGRLAGRRIVAASAGNWGQAVAWACRARGLPLTLFASVNANPLKVDRMRALGAEMQLAGGDFDAAKAAAAAFAAEENAVMLVDGLDTEAAEGAGTMAIELLAEHAPEVLLVPLGNGALLTGVARWAKAVHPGIRIIGVQAAGADAMEKSWRTGLLSFPPTIATIADGIGVRVPIPEAVEDMQGLVDDVVLVEDSDIIHAMRLLFDRAGLLIEPSGAAGVAAILAHPSAWKGAHVATVLCGSNLSDTQIREWLL